MNPKAFYKNYLADDNTSELNSYLCQLIELEKPNSVFEFGCGTGKNLKLLYPSIVTCGLDISMQNIQAARYKNNVPFLILGDEYHLGHIANFDVAFSCSVLDHIEDITKIIEELKRIAPIVYLAEADWQAPDKFYWSHDYEYYGFNKVMMNTGEDFPIPFDWKGEDNATYYIWRYAR